MSADGLHLALDISTFYIFHQQSVYLFALWFIVTGRDTAGNPIWTVTFIDYFFPSIAVGGNVSWRLRDTEGNLFDTATTRAGATLIILADLLPIEEHR